MRNKMKSFEDPSIAKSGAGKKTFIVSALILQIFGASLFFNLPKAEAAIIYLDQSDAGATLSSAGDTYELTEDITCSGDGLIIGTDGITINGAGFTLTGDGDWGDYGIRNTTGKDNVIIRNFSNITNFSDGIHFEGSTGSTIEDNIVNSNGYYGIYLYSSTGNTLDTNTTNSNNYGIYIDNFSTGNTLLTNTANSNTNHGIYLYFSASNILDGNLMSSNPEGNLNVAGDTIYYNNDIDTSNYVEGKPVYYLYGHSDETYDGDIVGDIGMFWCISCDNVTVRDTTLAANNIYGIHFKETTNSHIINVTSNSNKFGIRLDTSSGNHIQDSTTNANTTDGMYILSSPDNTLQTNTANANKNSGIVISSSSGNDLQTNTANSNALHGIFLSSASGNTLTGNLMSSNQLGNFYVIYWMADFNNNIDTSNKVEGKPIYYLYGHSDETYDGDVVGDIGMFWCINCDNVTVRDTTLSANNTYGILFKNTDNSRIINVTSNDNWFGVYLDSSSGNYIQTSTTTNFNSDSGIYLTNSSSNTLQNNIVVQNQNGIYLTSSSNNTIENNALKFNRKDIVDDNTNTYSGNQCFYNLQSKMLTFTEIDRTKITGNTVNFNAEVFNFDGSDCNDCVPVVTTSPSEVVDVTKTDNDLAGGFTATRPGTYSLIFHVTDTVGNVTEQFYRFLVGSSYGEKTTKYYLRGVNPTHGQTNGNGNDTKSLLLTPPTEEEQWFCSNFIQNSPDETPDYPLANLTDINTYTWYKQDADDGANMGVQQYVTYDPTMDEDLPIPAVADFTRINRNFSGLNWFMDYPQSWYWLAMKIAGSGMEQPNPIWRTQPDSPPDNNQASYADFVHQYTTTPAIKSFTNPENIRILSATASSADLDNASIALDGTGDTDIVLDSYKRPFSGYTTTITPTTATLAAAGISGQTTIDSVDMDITPDAGSIAVTIDTWNTGGNHYKKWTEDGADGVASAAHRVGDLELNTDYTVTVNDVEYGVYTADGNGEINFSYTGGYSTKTFEVEDAAPTVDSTNPADLDTEIAINTTITATFSEDMDESTIVSPAESFTLKDSHDTPAGGTVTYADKTATFTPTINLTNGETYTATITTGATDLVGSPLASDHVWSFTTINKVATPTFDPTGGTFRFAQEVTIGCVTEGAAIYYTTDGTDPTEANEEYSLPINVSEPQTLKAKAYKAGMDPSETAVTRFVISRKPTFDIDGDKIDDLAGVSSNNKIYYTINKEDWINIPGTLSALATGDVNGDGYADIAGIKSTGRIYYTTNETDWTMMAGKLTKITSGDLNGDGAEDIVGLGYDHPEICWYTLDLGASWHRMSGHITNIALGDLDNDGDYDLIGTGLSGRIYYSTNKTSWTRIPEKTFSSFTAGDLDGNGDDDIIGYASNGAIWYSLDNSTWTSAPGYLTNISSGDLDGDGDDDIAGLGYAHPGVCWYTLDLGTNWNRMPGTVASLAIGDLDGNGSDDIVSLSASGNVYYTTDKTSWVSISGIFQKIYSAR